MKRSEGKPSLPQPTLLESFGFFNVFRIFSQKKNAEISRKNSLNGLFFFLVTLCLALFSRGLILNPSACIEQGKKQMFYLRRSDPSK